MKRGDYRGGSTVWTGKNLAGGKFEAPAGQSTKSIDAASSTDPLLKTLGEQLADVEIAIAKRISLFGGTLEAIAVAVKNGPCKHFDPVALQNQFQESNLERFEALDEERLCLGNLIDNLEGNRPAAVNHIKIELAARLQRHEQNRQTRVP